MVNKHRAQDDENLGIKSLCEENNIREANVDDASSLAQIHIKTWRQCYRGQMPDNYLNNLSEEDLTNFWTKILSGINKESKTIVAEIGKKVIGFGSVGFSRDVDSKPKTGEFYALYVDPSNQHNSFGSLLLERGMYHLSELRCTKATLWVLSTNNTAIGFFKSKGWKDDQKKISYLIDETLLVKMRYFYPLG